MNIGEIKNQNTYGIGGPVAARKKPDNVPSDSVVIDKSKGDNAELFSSMDKLRQEALKSDSVKSAGAEFKSGFITQYLDARQVDKKVLELAEKYPDLVKVHTRDFQTSGYDGKMTHLQGPAPLRYIRIGRETPDQDKKPGVLLAAAPHAREMMQPMIMLETAHQLLENYNPESSDPKVKEITDLIDGTDIYIVAVSNPDGLNYAFYDDQDWRKTRSPIPGSEHKGVDCNRNYGYKWKESDPASAVYSGPYPNSEPETRHVSSIVDEHPNIKFFADFHSRGDEIRRPLGIEDETTLNKYKGFQQRMQDAVKSSRGKEYSMIESLVVNGASDDYFHFEKGVYSFVIENGQEFKPELPEALEIVKENAELAKELIRITRDYQA